MKKKKIILASSSPRRREILHKMGLNFEIVSSDYNEILDNNIFSYEKIEKLAFGKANAVLKTLSSEEYCIILSADTVVVLNDKILGKPKNEAEAIKMLTMLSGQKHSVVTSACAINTLPLQKKIISETSYVEFEDLSKDLILDYVKTFKPLDKAGSYGIQELPKGFVRNIDGSFENIMGLCSNVVNNLLKEFDLQI